MTRKRGDELREGRPAHSPITETDVVHRVNGKPPPKLRPYNAQNYVPREEFEELQRDQPDEDPNKERPTAVHSLLRSNGHPPKPEELEPTEAEIQRAITDAAEQRAHLAQLELDKSQKAQNELDERLRRLEALQESAEQRAADAALAQRRVEQTTNPDEDNLEIVQRTAEKAAALAKQRRTDLDMARAAAEAAEEEEQRHMVELQAAKEAAMRLRLKGVFEEDVIERMLRESRNGNEGAAATIPPPTVIDLPPTTSIPQVEVPPLAPSAPKPPEPEAEKPSVVDAPTQAHVVDWDDKEAPSVPSAPERPIPVVAPAPPLPEVVAETDKPQIRSPRKDRGVHRRDAKGLSVDTDDVPELKPGNQTGKVRGNAPANLAQGLALPDDESETAAEPSTNRSSGKDFAKVAGGLCVSALSSMWALFNKQNFLLKAGSIAGAVLIVLIWQISPSGNTESCRVTKWAPHTILWLKDCTLATADKRTIATVNGETYNLMAESPQGFKPQAIPYIWMLVGSGGNDAYTNAPQQLSGLIPQTRDKLAVAAKGLGLPESSLTEVNNSKTKFGAPSHTSSWLMAAWSLNSGWAALANNPALRMQYDARCKEMAVKEVQLGRQVSLCQLLMHVLPPKWTEKIGNKSLVRLLVDLIWQWKDPESQVYDSIKPNLENQQLKVANDRACGQHSPGVIKGVDCPKK